jgi:hypothetical protein
MATNKEQERKNITKLMQSARARNRTSRPQNQNPNGQNLPLYVRKLLSKNCDDPTVQTPVIVQTLLLGLCDI